MNKYYKVLATNDYKTIEELTPFTTIESAERVARKNGCKHNLIINNNNKIIKKVEM